MQVIQVLKEQINEKDQLISLAKENIAQLRG